MKKALTLLSAMALFGCASNDNPYADLPTTPAYDDKASFAMNVIRSIDSNTDPIRDITLSEDDKRKFEKLQVGSESLTGRGSDTSFMTGTALGLINGGLLGGLGAMAFELGSSPNTLFRDVNLYVHWIELPASPSQQDYDLALKKQREALGESLKDTYLKKPNGSVTKSVKTGSYEVLFDDETCTKNNLKYKVTNIKSCKILVSSTMAKAVSNVNMEGKQANYLVAMSPFYTNASADLLDLNLDNSYLYLGVTPSIQLKDKDGDTVSLKRRQIPHVKAGEQSWFFIKP